jgi:hypothetical protein
VAKGTGAESDAKKKKEKKTVDDSSQPPPVGYPANLKVVPMIRFMVAPTLVYQVWRNPHL